MCVFIVPELQRLKPNLWKPVVPGFMADVFSSGCLSTLGPSWPRGWGVNLIICVFPNRVLISHLGSPLPTSDGPLVGSIKS